MESQRTHHGTNGLFSVTAVELAHGTHLSLVPTGGQRAGARGCGRAQLFESRWDGYIHDMSRGGGDEDVARVEHGEGEEEGECV